MSVELLKKACDYYKSQRLVGSMIGKSGATVNLLLKGKYPNPHEILQTVGKVFADLNSTEFKCSELGVIHVDVCRRYQAMAKQGKVHKDRLYMQVRNSCVECIGVNDD